MKFIKTYENILLNERRSNFNSPEIDHLKPIAKEAFIPYSNWSGPGGNMVEVSVDSDNRDLPEGEFSIMPFDGGDYYKASVLKQIAKEAVERMNNSLKGSRGPVQKVKLVKVNRRDIIVKINESVNEDLRPDEVEYLAKEIALYLPTYRK